MTLVRRARPSAQGRDLVRVRVRARARARVNPNPNPNPNRPRPCDLQPVAALFCVEVHDLVRARVRGEGGG